MFPMSEIAMVIVTYNPDFDLVGEKIQVACSKGAWVIWIDNASPNLQRQWILTLTLGNPKLVFIPLRKNLGLSAPLRLASILARRLGVRYLLYIDQDSILCPTFLNLYQNAKQKAVQLSGSDDLIILANYVDLSLDDDPFTLLQEICKSDSCVEDTPEGLGITSGMFIPLHVIDRIGGISKKYILDFVDYNLIIRARASGIKLYKYKNPMMLQPIGRLYTFRTLFGKIRLIYHSPVRYKLMGAALTNLIKDHFEHDPRLLLQITFRIMKKLLKIMIFMKDYRCFSFFLHGIVLGLLPEKEMANNVLKVLNP